MGKNKDKATPFRKSKAVDASYNRKALSKFGSTVKVPNGPTPGMPKAGWGRKKSW